MLLISPLFLWGQESSFPKDTIYVKYVSKKVGNKKIMDWCYKDESGIYFSIRDSSHILPNNTNKFISLFYSYSESMDTISIEKIENYHFSNLKEIDQKRIDWIKKKFTGRFKPYNHSRNHVFQTYLIEEISNNRMVIYPVIWRNEGVIP